MSSFSSQTLADPAAATAALAADFGRWLHETPGILNLAISGGRTPEALFSMLAREYRTHPWERLRFFWVDECWVPQDNPESRFGLAWQRLFQPLGIPLSQLHPMVSPESLLGKPAFAAARYSQLLHRELPLANGVPVFDLVMLGMGGDGSTASLFPDAVLETPNAPCSATRHPQTGAPRLTLTLPVLNQAKRVLFLVTGADKATAIRKLRTDSRCDLPAAAVKPRSGPAAWYLDRAAAGE